MKRIVVVASLAVGGAVLGWTAWASYTRHIRREELLAIRAAITPGMSREDAVRIVKAHGRRTVFQDDDELSLLCVDEAKYLGAWILCIRFSRGRAVAVHIGNYDDVFTAPPGAPSALVWGPAEEPSAAGGHTR